MLGLARLFSFVYTPPIMTTHSLPSTAFRQLLSDLSLSIPDCAQLLQVDPVAVENWFSGSSPIPGPAAVALELLQSNRQLELALDLHIEKVKELSAGAGELDELRGAARAVIAARSGGCGLDEALARLAELLNRSSHIH